MSSLRFLLLVILGFAYLNPRAQIVTIDNNGASSGVTQASPVNIYWRRQVAQFVISVAELNAAGINNPNVLSGIGFNVTSNPIHVIPGYTVKIKHVTQVDVSNNLGANGWTIAKAPFNYSPVPGGYDMISFDNNFNWDGVQNIGVEICWSQVQPTWNSSGQCLVYASNNGYRYSRDDNAGSLCGSQPGTSVNYKPAVKLAFKTSATWLGTQDNDWFNSNNWDIGIPSQDLNAIIPSGSLNAPVINGSNAECKDIIIDPNNSLSFVGSDSLFVYGDWFNNGLLDEGQGTIVFRGDQANQINGISNQLFNNIKIDSQNGAAISSGSVKLKGTLDIAIASGSFDTGDSLTIQSDSSGTGRIGELKTKCIYTLDMSDSWGDSWNGGYISIYINGVLEGTYFAKGFNSTEIFSAEIGATVSLDYTSGLYENENSYDLRDGNNNIIFSDGPTPIVGSNVFTTVANCTFFNPISGNIFMERYIDAGSTHWRFLSAAVQGATISDLNDDFITSGFIGSDYPNWPSVANPWPSIYFYDESNTGIQDSGYIPVNNVTNNIGVGQGVWAWSGDTITGTQPFTIDMFGPPNVGDIPLPVSYTSTGMPLDDGWNMVGNPYPSAINWDSPSIVKTNIDNAVYIWNPDLQQFASYIGGIGINGGSSTIASNQAFWIKANTGSPSLILTEASKTSVNTSFIKPSAKNIMRIEVQNNFGSDEAVLTFKPNAINQFEPYLDAIKLGTLESNLPSIASMLINDSIEYGINQMADTTHSVLLKITTGQSGLHNLTFNGVSNFSNTQKVIIEDLHLGISYNLSNQTTVMVYLWDTAASPRFLLRFENNLSTSVLEKMENNDFRIFPNPSTGTFYIDGIDIKFDVIVKDMVGKNILFKPGLVGMTSIDISDKPRGVYLLMINLKDGRTLTKKIIKH
jgi:hypothetical protein